MIQARMMAEAVVSASAGEGQSPVEVEIVPLTSEGDRDQKTRLDRFTTPGVFTRTLEEALLDRRIDAAVHSAKDMPSLLEPAFLLPCALPRASAHDALVAGKDTFLMSLPEGARVGSSSPRRIAQLKRVRGDIAFVPLRGNLATRLGKLDRGDVDALILAAAGLARQGFADRVSELIPFDICLAAAGQGTIVAETLKESPWNDLLDAAGCRESRLRLEAERVYLRKLGAGCSAAVAAHASLANGKLDAKGRVLTLDGKKMIEGERSVHLSPAEESALSRAEETGAALADDLISRGALDLLESSGPAS